MPRIVLLVLADLVTLEAAATLVQAVPSLVSTFPAVPADATPVPPFATGKVPVTPVDRGMSVNVLLAPLIVLLVSVLVLVAVRTLLGVMMFERFAMLYSG